MNPFSVSHSKGIWQKLKHKITVNEVPQSSISLYERSTGEQSLDKEHGSIFAMYVVVSSVEMLCLFHGEIYFVL